MKVFQVPENVLAAMVSLIERLPAQRDVRVVLNTVDVLVQQHEKEWAERDAKIANPVVQGGGGPGEEQPPPVKK